MSVNEWYRHAGVRNASEPTPKTGLNEGLLFSPPLLPVFVSKIVQSATSETRQTLLRSYLESYLAFTIALELMHIGPTAMALSVHGYGYELPEAVRIEATQIACDEAFHALRCQELLQDIGCSHRAQALIGVAAARLERETQAITSLLDEKGSGDLVFAIVAEIMITDILLKVPEDQLVAPEVRLAVAEHARDEARHRAYFLRLLGLVWPQMGSARRILTTKAVRLCITVFLRNQLPTVDPLVASGFSLSEAQLAVGEPAVVQEARRASQSVVRRTLRRLDVLMPLSEPKSSAQHRWKP